MFQILLKNFWNISMMGPASSRMRSILNRHQPANSTERWILSATLGGWVVQKEPLRWPRCKAKKSHSWSEVDSVFSGCIKHVFAVNLNSCRAKRRQGYCWNWDTVGKSWKISTTGEVSSRARKADGVLSQIRGRLKVLPVRSGGWGLPTKISV